MFDAIDHSLVTGLKGYGYADAEWGDLLTSFNGVQFTYDAIGNPLSYYNGKNYSMTWQNGRQLSSVTKDGVTTSYGYNADGIRTSKTVDGTTTYFVLDGDRIIFEGNMTEYYYDESGAPVGIKYNGSIYYFIKNLQGDVVAIYDNTGTCVVEYLYDAWGKVLSITGSKADTLGVANPFRYRGYYYDNETGFYYLQSRYYDPSIGRFINADGIIGANGDLVSYNLFAYCSNNPIMFIDPSGEVVTESALLYKALELLLTLLLLGAGTAVVATEMDTISIPAPTIRSKPRTKVKEKVEEKVSVDVAPSAPKDSSVYYGAVTNGASLSYVTQAMSKDKAISWAYRTANSDQYGKKRAWGIYTPNQSSALNLATILGGGLPPISHSNTSGQFNHYHVNGYTFNGKYEHFHIWYGTYIP